MRLQPIRSAIAFCALSMALAGCSMTPSSEQPVMHNSNVAVLHADDHLRVLAIDGKKQLPPLLGHFAKDFELSPGAHTIEFKYVSVWTKRQFNPDQVDNAIAIDSVPQALTFNAEAGHRYHFAYPKAGTREETRALVSNFKPKLIDQGGKVAVKTTTAAVDSATLGQLKSLWQNASPKDRKAFLDWAYKTR